MQFWIKNSICQMMEIVVEIVAVNWRAAPGGRNLPDHRELATSGEDSW